MTKDELKLVLDALKWCHGGEPCGTAEAIAVVEKALAQEQEPVAWRTFDGEGGYDYRDYDMNENYRDEYIKRNGTKYASWVESLYNSHPNQKPLSDEQRDTISCQAAKNKWSAYKVIDAVEAAHGIKE